MPSFRSTAALLLLALAAPGCRGPTDAPGPAAEIQAVSSLAPTGTVGSALVDSLVVRVTDARGNPVRGATVRWEAAPGSGSVQPGAAVSDAKGRAAARWTLGAAAGAQTVAAVVQGAGGVVSVTFQALARPGPAASITVSPLRATLPPDSTLALGVRLADAYGNPVTEQGVAWSSADTVVATVDASGVVRARGSGRRVRVTALAGALSATAEVAVASRFRALATGLLHTCLVRDDGAALCAGDNASGQLGTGSTTSSATPERVAGGIAFAAVAAGSAHSCGVTAAGVAFCWGSNEAGQLGSGSTAGSSSVPVAVAGGHTFRSVAAGARHACGITTAGTALCWGSNASGQLGTRAPLETCGGATLCSRTPVGVEGSRVFAAVTAGAEHTCALDRDGAAFCWGAGGALGTGSTGGSPTPAAVAGGVRFAGLSAGFFHTCAAAADGAAYCWGSNAFGELGNGGGPASAVPVRVSGEARFASVAAGGFHGCALTAEGRAHCWGANGNGELGTGTGGNRSTPAPVAGGLLFASLSLGRDHTCGLSLRGHAYCWGLGALGRGGDAPQTPRLLPEI